MTPPLLSALSSEQLWRLYRSLDPDSPKEAELFMRVVTEIGQRIAAAEVQRLITLAREMAG